MNVIFISRNGSLMDEMIITDQLWYDFTLQWNESFYNWTSEIASRIGLSRINGIKARTCVISLTM